MARCGNRRRRLDGCEQQLGGEERRRPGNRVGDAREPRQDAARGGGRRSLLFEPTRPADSAAAVSGWFGNNGQERPFCGEGSRQAGGQEERDPERRLVEARSPYGKLEPHTPQDRPATIRRRSLGGTDQGRRDGSRSPGPRAGTTVRDCCDRAVGVDGGGAGVDLRIRCSEAGFRPAERDWRRRNRTRLRGYDRRSRRGGVGQRGVCSGRIVSDARAGKDHDAY